MTERERRRRNPKPAAPRRVGLVLGGGGVVGAAYHAGALAALEHDLGWDARAADVIVGTSAGSLVGALLRLDVPATDLAAMTVGAPALETSATVRAAVTGRPEFPPLSLRELLRPRLPDPRTLLGLSWLGLRAGVRALPMVSMLLPEGRQVLGPHLEFFDQHVPDGWPVDPLLVCAVRRPDCRRAVFGPGGRTATLGAAVAASCAVPGYFQGVEIDGTCYVDGGALSATNADVLRRHELDVVIIVSPMTGGSRVPSLSGAMRSICRRALHHEREVLERHGIPTVVIEPGRDVLAHVSNDFMDPSQVVDIVRESFMDTGAQIAKHPILRSLEPTRRVSVDEVGGRSAS